MNDLSRNTRDLDLTVQRETPPCECQYVSFWITNSSDRLVQHPRLTHWDSSLAVSPSEAEWSVSGGPCVPKSSPIIGSTRGILGMEEKNNLSKAISRLDTASCFRC